MTLGIARYALDAFSKLTLKQCDYGIIKKEPANRFTRSICTADAYLSRI